MCYRPALLLSLVLLSNPYARAGDLFGPTLGLVPDASAGVLRLVRGIPGAASLGEPITLGPDIASISIAPRRGRAAFATGDAIRLVSVAPDGSLGTSTPIDASPSSQVSFSPSGLTAAIYDAAAGAVWLHRETGVRIDVSALPDTIALLAASDSPDAPVAGTLLSDPRTVFLLDGKGGFRLLPGFSEVTDLTFLGSSGDLAICDRGRILLLRDPLSGSAPEILLDLDSSPQSPYRIASSMDGNSLAVLSSAHAGRGPVNSAPAAQASRLSLHREITVGLLRLADRQWSPVDCQCEPSGLYPMAGNAVFRLTQSVDSPLWILDGDTAEPRAAFVPAVLP